MTTQAYPKVAVLVFPFAAPNTFTFARKLAQVFSLVSEQTLLVSGDIPKTPPWPAGVQLHDIGIRLHYMRDKQPRWLSAVIWITRLILAQVKLSMAILRLRDRIDVVVCSLGIYYQLPVIVARLCGKKVITTCFGDYAVMLEMAYGSKSLIYLLNALVRFVYRLSDVILVESLRLVEERAYLIPYQSKVKHGALFVEDLAHFSVNPDADKSENLVGFIGRLMNEKGVNDFLQAIPLALKQHPDLRFLLVGTGRLDDQVAETLRHAPWGSRVEWLKWVDHRDMPLYLNRLSSLVIPSYTEGLPNLALEAMACGTPLLATAVGGIPDLIQDGETGFLLDDHSPATISAGIIRVLDHDELAKITTRARSLIEACYSLQAASHRYQNIMDHLVKVS